MAKVETKVAIAKILSDGEFHSGETLGKHLGISRAAIANHIKSLSSLGLDIYSVTGRGYKLSSNIELLDSNKINSFLNKFHEIDTYSIIDSTNEYLMNKIRGDEKLINGHSVIAECQTAGRGRRGRTWQSPFGSHVYFSQYRIIEDGLSAAAGLSLAVGIAVRRACARVITHNIELKWPNDVLADGKKLAGVLIEAEGQSDGQCHLVIGIGINFDMPAKYAEEIEQEWTDLKLLAGKTIDRNFFVAGLLEELDDILDEYKENRLENLVAEWNLANAFKDMDVEVSSNTLVKSGSCIGIDSSGALLLESHQSGKIEKIFGGEVSLRKV